MNWARKTHGRLLGNLRRARSDIIASGKLGYPVTKGNYVEGKVDLPFLNRWLKNEAGPAARGARDALRQHRLATRSTFNEARRVKPQGRLAQLLDAVGAGIGRRIG